MRQTPVANSLFQSSEFQMMLRERVRSELYLERRERTLKYKIAGLIIVAIFAFALAMTLAFTLATILTEVVEHWLFGR